MKKRKVLAVLLCAAMTAALAVGCGGSKGSDSSDKSSDSSSSSDDVITVGFSQVGAESDWRTAALHRLLCHRDGVAGTSLE